MLDKYKSNLGERGRICVLTCLCRLVFKCILKIADSCVFATWSLSSMPKLMRFKMQNQNTCTEGLFQTFEHCFSIMDLVLFPAMKSTYVQSKYMCVCVCVSWREYMDVFVLLYSGEKPHINWGKLAS